MTKPKPPKVHKSWANATAATIAPAVVESKAPPKPKAQHPPPPPGLGPYVMKAIQHCADWVSKNGSEFEETCQSGLPQACFLLCARRPLFRVVPRVLPQVCQWWGEGGIFCQHSRAPSSQAPH